ELKITVFMGLTSIAFKISGNELINIYNAKDVRPIKRVIFQAKRDFHNLLFFLFSCLNLFFSFLFKICGTQTINPIRDNKHHINKAMFQFVSKKSVNVTLIPGAIVENIPIDIE